MRLWTKHDVFWMVMDTITSIDHRYRSLCTYLKTVREISRTALYPIDVKHQRTYDKVTVPKLTCEYKPTGVHVIVWTTGKNYRRVQQLTTFWWYMAHILFWLYNTNLWPSGSAVPLDQPPWRYVKPLRVFIAPPKPKDYIIEPDWDNKN